MYGSLSGLSRLGHNVSDRMRFSIYETKLIKTTRFEPEELEKIEQVARIIDERAREAREDPPSESQVIRMLVRLGLEAFHERRKPAAPSP